MEKCLYKWFLNQREKKNILTGPVLKAKPNSIFSVSSVQVYPDKDENVFTATYGWFSKFKTRHGLRFLKISGEILSSDIGAVTPFLHRFRAKVAKMGLLETQTYNADESGLFCIPDKTFVAACEKRAQEFKTQKERV